MVVRVCEHVQWRFVLNGRLALGQVHTLDFDMEGGFIPYVEKQCVRGRNICGPLVPPCNHHTITIQSTVY
jgi:hypothetical protein